ncbi:MAG TPA: type II toxin-antitoxin system ParD family antitoxin [Vineibacter sp.]|nr:type II toxin-antitoxin system ParD family antitoxin [Vineibacter sp.]
MAAVRKLSVTLPAELARLVEGKVRSGDYASASDVVREALRHWQWQTDERERRLAALDTAIARGIGDAANGRVRSIDAVRKTLRAKFAVGATRPAR